ncbi:MAG: hypothetical protein KGL39_40975 [Patescibacteria group bacterium]|nr:hypothetical protein [Patescibacteria group bacterium]
MNPVCNMVESLGRVAPAVQIGAGLSKLMPKWTLRRKAGHTEQFMKHIKRLFNWLASVIAPYGRQDKFGFHKTDINGKDL